MDARKDRIGEHAAEHALSWATGALGPVPGHPVDRLEWQRRAASIGAYRELSGYDNPVDLIGPEPAAAAPDRRAAWYEALAALGPVDGPDVRGMPDGTLLHLRDTYPVETAWAPQWVGGELRQVRVGAWEARLAAARAGTEAAAAERSGYHEAAARHQALAVSYKAIEHAYRDRERVFAGVMADRADWEAATRVQRHLAVAADAELRRRHPGQRFTPPRSAEPHPATDAQRAELALIAGRDIPVAGQWIKDLAAGHRTFAGKLANRQSQMIPPKTPAMATSARPSPPGSALGRVRSCSRPSRRSVPRPASWNASRTGTPTSKPGNDRGGPIHLGRTPLARNTGIVWSATGRLLPHRLAGVQFGSARIRGTRSAG